MKNQNISHYLLKCTCSIQDRTRESCSKLWREITCSPYDETL